MAVDASKLKKFGRRGLGLPPSDGSPGIEEGPANTADPLASEPQNHIGTGAHAVPGTERATILAALAVTPEAPSARTRAAEAQLGREGRGGIVTQLEAEERRVTPVAGRGGGEQGTVQGRYRVPPHDAEPRVPFTTRITSSTKERLEDACYHLRRKHQDFINEAIAAHLEKHGF
jgi:hypothetical protein